MTIEPIAIRDVIAERVLTLVGSSVHQEIRVLLGRPQKFEDSEDFYCPYQIVGLGDGGIRHAAGVDSMQAIQIALQLVASEIHNVHRDEAASLRWHGNENLGLPVLKDYFGPF